MKLRYWTVAMAVSSIAIAIASLRVAYDHNQIPGKDAMDGLFSSQTQNIRFDDGVPSSTTNDAAPSLALTGDAVTWSRIVGEGESLSALLAQAGLESPAITEVSRAIGSAYDLRRIKPGYRLLLEQSAEDLPHAVALEIEDGVQILATFGTDPSVRTVPPVLESRRLAGEAVIGSSIYASLERAGIPTRFATDLELIFAGTLDLRSALNGGEHLRVLWREDHTSDRVIGEPTIDFIELDLGDDRYAVVWPDNDHRRTIIYRNGEIMRTFIQPIPGARLSSAFGPRVHPVHGYTRMHSGVDFGAPMGAVVEATVAGRIVFMGTRSGYGLIVELEHAQGIRTRYAHLSALNETLKVGQKVASGDEIGRVGSTGTSTAPHLHYEILVKGQAVSPLTSTDLTDLGESSPPQRDPILLVNKLQDDFQRLVAAPG